MKFAQDFLYVIYRNGNRFRHFSTRQTALNYIAACWDLDPNSSWSLACEEVTHGV